MNRLNERIKELEQPLLGKEIGEKKIREDYWMIFNEFGIAEFMLSDCISLGKKLKQEEILKIINNLAWQMGCGGTKARELNVDLIIKEIKGEGK